MDRFADNGLRYTNMHTTALCSPSRGAILTGRNHHSLGLATIAETSTGYPGYNAILPFDKGMLSEMLLPHGYNTFLVGKWHLAPPEHETAAGPYDRWPLGRGFERFYGFLGGDTNQWYPELVYDNHSIEQPAQPEDGYHLSADLADRAIEFIQDAHVNAPDKPFYLHYCTGAGHAPHHVVQGVGRQVQRQVRRRLGRVPQGGPPAPARDGHHPGRDRAVRARPRRPRVGHASGGCPEGVRADDGGVRRVRQLHRSRVRPGGQLPGGDRRARQHLVPAHLRQRRELGGRTGRIAQRDDVLQRRPGVDRGEPGATRRAGRPQRLQPLRLGMDQRGEHAVPALEAGDLPRRHHRPVHRLLAGQDHRAR